MVQLRCPVCRAPLTKTEKTYCCASRHSYDIARSGYVNLLPPSPAAKRHGDDKRMVQARCAFLSGGFYDDLIRCVSRTAFELCKPDSCIVDAGCGEGTYTRQILNTCQKSGKPVSLLGVDISTDALQKAARLCPDAQFCAASTANMPLADGSVDLLMNIFSPFMAEEFLRVLSPGGYLLRVTPLQRHLWELKAAIYDTPYENPPLDYACCGLELLEQQKVERLVHLSSPADIANLFMMTPYYYKTGVADQQKLLSLTQLDITASFAVTTYRKV